MTYAELALGTHVIAVRACDPDTGVCDATPAQTTFEVVDLICEVPLAVTCDEALTRDAPADACAWSGTITGTATYECVRDVSVEANRDTYAVGMSVATFTATGSAGNSDMCETAVTVRDVTKPEVVCGTWDAARSQAEARGSDACGVTVVASGVTCWRLGSDGARELLPGDGCPARADGAVVLLDGGVGAPLVVSWTVTGTDPSGNVTTLACEEALNPDTDGDGVVDGADNCPLDANADQRDSDLDGVGDPCDSAPFEGLVAQGDGACGGGGAGSLGWVLMLTWGGILLARRRRGLIQR